VYRLLAAYYLRLGEISRAVRSHAVMSQLGFAEDADRAEAARLRPQAAVRAVVRPSTTTCASRCW
jgi:hypothetical protein